MDIIITSRFRFSLVVHRSTCTCSNLKTSSHISHHLENQAHLRIQMCNLSLKGRDLSLLRTTKRENRVSNIMQFPLQSFIHTLSSWLNSCVNAYRMGLLITWCAVFWLLGCGRFLRDDPIV